MLAGFLFNHATPHQVPHTASIAFELSRSHPEVKVVMCCSTTAELNLCRRIGELYPGHHCRFERLRIPRIAAWLDPLVTAVAFQRKQAVLKANRALLQSFDVLISPELNCIRLHRDPRFVDLKMVFFPHGAGDRAVGFDKRIRDFDLVLLPGRKTRDRMLAEGCIACDKSAIIGYPKFEVMAALNPAPPSPFDDDRPIVLYNPHFDNTLSSWRRMGIPTLEFFAEHREYNLIFAPHVVLFKRWLRHRAWLPKRFLDLSNIHIDTGSERSLDMTYTRIADLYLGDVSSQIYEFLATPRPAIFLNAHNADWREDPNYAHWHLGEVIDSVEPALERALQRAPAVWKDTFRARQREAFAATFQRDPERPAARAGADAIAEWMQPDR